jgi:signal peptidase II
MSTVRLFKNKWSFFGLVTIAGLAIDLFTKFLAVKNLPQGVPVPVFGDGLSWLLVYNKGALFGIKPQNYLPGFPVHWFFVIFSIIAVIVLILYYRSICTKDWWSRSALAILMAGALGNFMDRVLAPGRGVVDFICVNLGFPPFNPWPIFNIADIYISVGIGIMLITMLREENSCKNIQKLPCEDSLSQPASTDKQHAAVESKA